MSKLPKKLTQKEVDKLWSLRVKERDGFKCQLCENVGHLNSHHIFHKASHALRYSLENGITLCVGCHKFGIHSPDLDVVWEFETRLVEKIGYGRLGRLRELKLSKEKLSLAEAWERLGGSHD